MNSSNLSKELLEYFNYDVDTASSATLVQQRGKILPQPSEYLFKAFPDWYKQFKTFYSYPLLVVDGLKFNNAHYPNDLYSYITCSENARGFNMIHLNAIYDLMNKLYLLLRFTPLENKTNRYG